MPGHASFQNWQLWPFPSQLNWWLQCATVCVFLVLYYNAITSEIIPNSIYKIMRFPIKLWVNRNIRSYLAFLSLLFLLRWADSGLFGVFFSLVGFFWGGGCCAFFLFFYFLITLFPKYPSFCLFSLPHNFLADWLYSIHMWYAGQIRTDKIPNELVILI